MKKNIIILFMAIFIFNSPLMADSDFFKKLKNDYSQLEIELNNSYGRKADIKNFVYKKDAATFNFVEGEMHLLRYVNNRPTTALFIGKGHAKIEIPSELEKNSLRSVADVDAIDEDFETCFIRMADNFDLILEEQFSFVDEKLGWREYNYAKDNQGEYFFRPSIQHKYDNNFQLLKSIYERNENGYFWIDFNRFNFNFDPNCPEQVRVSYEIEGGNSITTDAAVFKKYGSGSYDNSTMSEMIFETEPIEYTGKLHMTGLDGMEIKPGKATMKLLITADSLRFVNYFHHFNLKTDSVFSDGVPVDFHRRRDFACGTVILPEYKMKGDTVEITIWFRGKAYDCPLPYVDNPKPVMHNIIFDIPKDYNYTTSDMGPLQDSGKNRKQFVVKTQRPYRKFYFQGYASGYDTLTHTSDMGLAINFLKSKHLKKSMNCYIPDETYENNIIDAFNFYFSRFGTPIGTFSEVVYPEGYLISMPGLIKAPQIACVTDGSMKYIGGYHIIAGNAVARQWFGSAVQTYSNREAWLLDAVPEYMSMLFMQSDLDGGEFYSNMVNKRDSVYRVVERKWDVPLAVGIRQSETIPMATIRQNKGAWLLHMLRFVMFDTETQSDRSFIKFLHELIVTANNKQITNADVIKIAEKKYGDDLSWFFNQWLYGTNFPNYKVEHSFIEKNGKYFVKLDVNTTGVPDNFKMPVMLRVESKNGSRFIKQMIPSGKSTHEIGPFETKLEKFHFNEFFSVLSKDDVK
ncbi:MAG: hypothetical protein DRP35_00095 [Candidatus Zixiibacteriota bacterium]|nr:MAG: hypothetical protein DRP35_00095 [candidate division Zixibacteria bacterium]